MCPLPALLSAIDYINQRKERKGFLFSGDQFKAYDRVLVRGYLDKVLQAMNFGPNFVSWILMLHRGATTRFILSVLSNPLQVLFSIRQGDPIAMLLYIVYIEPLLLMIRRECLGIKISFFKQVDVDYCDDVDFVSENESDIVRIVEVFKRFEDISGAILSRSAKTKIMGLGAWKDRQVWPLEWMKVVREMKVFGFQICQTYEQSLERSWEVCFEGFRKTLIAWGSRMLDSLRQRVDVLKIFATSKLWYKASALPLPEMWARKFEAGVRKFLWAGRLEQLALEEVMNPVEMGGLGLPCIRAKAEALFLKQSTRLLLCREGELETEEGRGQVEPAPGQEQLVPGQVRPGQQLSAPRQERRGHEEPAPGQDRGGQDEPDLGRERRGQVEPAPGQDRRRGGGEVYKHLSFWVGLQLRDFTVGCESFPIFQVYGGVDSRCPEAGGLNCELNG